MNYLMHLYLAGDDPESLVGNMMGDFVKGRLDDRYPPGVRQGIELHRRIDSFAAGNLFFLRSKRRLDPSFGLYRAVLVDLFYDHFLARRWEEFSPVPFEEFIGNAYRVLADHESLMPERLRQLLPRMFSTNLLLTYREPEGIAAVLDRMSQRISRSNPLDEGIRELSLRYDPLWEDFRHFLPELAEHVTALPVSPNKEPGDVDKDG
jgi:acyl carrier protein phosphodiesterase